MSEHDTSMSMNSLMEAIYGDQHTQYPDHQDQYLQQIPDFMQSLINHLIQLCVTQGFADNVQRTLSPWIRQIKSNSKNPKSVIQGFLGDFLRLFEQQTQKINKYGQKKLKYLTRTVSRQIFTQIMRTACDLKLESVNRTNSLKTNHKKVINSTTLIYSIDRLFTKDKGYALRTLKKSYYEGIKKQEGFINKLTDSISKLDRLCIKKRKNKLWKAVALWKSKVTEIYQEQLTLIYNNTKSFFRTILPQIVQKWQQKPQNWVTVVMDNISCVLKNLLRECEDIFVQFVPNPNLQVNNSLDYSALSSYRSGISRISSIDMQQYLKNEQIKYNNLGKYLAIPIIAEQQIGVIKISWQYQLPIVVFNKILKFVQLIKEIIQNFAKITTRLCYYSIEYENSRWQAELFNLYTKDEIFQIGILEEILGRAHVSLLEIYHNINDPSFCIKYGKQNAQPLPENIYKLIWQKLQTAQSFKLDRQNSSYQILRLQNPSGFCRFSFEETQQQQLDNSNLKQIIILSIVPLLTKNLGKIGCNSCNIKVKQLSPLLHSRLTQQSQVMKSNQSRPQFNFQHVIGLKDAKNVNQLENKIQQLLKGSFNSFPLYFKLLYPVSDTKNTYAYRNGQNKRQGKLIQVIQIPKSIANQNICCLQQNQADKMMRQTAKLMQSNPLFSQPELYLYQNERKRKLKIIPKKVGKRALILLATYQNKFERQLSQVLRLIGHQIQENDQIFSKKDLYNWASEKALRASPSMDLPNCKQIPQIKQLLGIEFPVAVKKLCEIFPSYKQFFMWRISNQNIKLIAGTKQNCVVENKLPFKSLLQQPIRSHQSVRAFHCTVRNSINFGHKLQQCLTYVPQFSTKQQVQGYAQSIVGNIDQSGESQKSIVHQISQFLQKISKIQKTQLQFISIPVKYKKITYVVIFVYRKQVQISNQMFEFMKNYIERSVSTILQYKNSKLRQKSQLYFKLQSRLENPFVPNNKTMLCKLVGKFNQNCLFQKERNRTISTVLHKIKYSLQYKQKKLAFCKLTMKAENLIHIYKSNFQYLYKVTLKIFAFHPLASACRKKQLFSNGLLKLENCLSNIFKNSHSQTSTQTWTRVSNKCFFISLKQFSDAKFLIKQNNIKISLQKIHEVYQKIWYKNTSKFFIKTLQNVFSLKRSLSILEEEFILMQPKNFKACLLFLEGRLNLMISQHFAMKINISIINCGFQDVQSKILQNDNYVFIQNSSFAFCIKSSLQGLEFNKNLISSQLEHILSKILPNWETRHRRNQMSKAKILCQCLQSARIKNLRQIFKVNESIVNKQNINSCNLMRNKANQQKQRMLQLQYQCHSADNLNCRENHKKQMEELKVEIGAVQNQLYRVGVDMRIKSKTNAAYRMLKLLNRKSQVDQRTGNTVLQMTSHLHQEIQHLKQSMNQQKCRYVGSVLPLWHSNLSKIINRNYRRMATQFMHALGANHRLF